MPRGALGIGLAAVARPAYITAGRDAPTSARRATSTTCGSAPRTVLDAAVALGVRYVDAARSYGLAEQFLAGWLAGAPGRATCRWAPSGATATSAAGGSTPTCTR